MRHSLYKYFPNREWAEEFLDGGLFFNSLGYFCDYEDEEVRGDKYEGTSVYRPTEGLVVNNHTKKITVTLQGWAMESTVNLEDVFVLCASRSLTNELRERFEAVVCVEITKIPTLCARIQTAMPGAKINAGKVIYYDPSAPPAERWALPDLIARSKVEGYRWQDEYRFFFSPTDALAFEKVNLRLTSAEPQGPRSAEHKHQTIRTTSLRDICRLHEF